jgi:hypothetical protein
MSSSSDLRVRIENALLEAQLELSDCNSPDSSLDRQVAVWERFVKEELRRCAEFAEDYPLVYLGDCSDTAADVANGIARLIREQFIAETADPQNP